MSEQPIDLATVPEHMREDAAFFNHFSPEFYEESECVCGRPIYRYKLDLIIEWKHFDHSVYCTTPQRAKPKS